MAEDLNIESQQPEVPVQDKTKVLYDAVSKDYNIGSYDEFSKKLQDPVKRKAFYDGVGNEYSLGTYDEFSSKVGGSDLKKKDQIGVPTSQVSGQVSAPIGLKLPSQKSNLPDYQKGLALAQKGYAMPSEGGNEITEKPSKEGSWGAYGSNIPANLLEQTFVKAADVDLATVKFLRNLSGKLPFTEKPQEIYDQNGQLTKYGQNIQSWDFMGKAIKDWTETQQKDKELLQTKYSLPNTTAGKITEGLVGIVPDLAATYAMGGKNLFSGTGTLAQLGNAVTSAFVREQALMGAAKGYNESDNKSAGQTLVNTIKEGAKSAGQGALYELGTFGGNKIGGLIGKGLTNATAKEAVNMGSRLTMLSLGVPLVEKGVQGELPTQDEFLQNLGVTGALELFHGALKAPEALLKKGEAKAEAKVPEQTFVDVANKINDVRSVSALNNFMKAPTDVIESLVKSDQSADNLNSAAADAAKRAESMPDGEEKDKVLKTAEHFTQLADIKHITEMIANSPNALEHMDLPDNIKDEFMQKAQAIHSGLNPTEVQKQSHVDTITQAEDIIKQNESLASPNNPNVKERLDAQREIDKAKATIDASTKDFNKTSDEQEAQKQALEQAKLAQQQAPVQPTEKVNVTEEVKPTEGEIDINERNKEYPSPGLIVKKFVAEGDNQLLTGEDAVYQDNSIERTISSGIKKGLTVDEIKMMLNANGHVFNFGNDAITINNYIKNRINGTETRPFGEFKRNTRVDIAEVKPTEAKTEVKPSLEEEYNSKTVDELIALKKKLYPNPDIETAMTPEEKLLDKVIAKKFSEKNQEIVAKRKIAAEEVKPTEEISVYHGGSIKDLTSSEGGLFVSADKNQAEYYAKGNKGQVQEFKLNKNDISNENNVREIINELGLKSKEEGWDLNDLMLHEIIDPRFETSLSEGDLKRLYNELDKRGYKAIEMLATDVSGKQKNVNDILILNPKETLKTEVKPTEVKGEVKTYNAKDLKENPEILEEDKDYHTLTKPKSFRSLYTDIFSMKRGGYENPKIGDIVNMFKKDYVVEGLMENKKNPDKTTVKLIRVDENGNLLREQDLSNKEQKEGKAKEFEEEEAPTEETPKKTYQEVLKEKQEAEKKQNREFGAEKATRTKEIFRKVSQMEAPEDAEQAALYYLANGGKISEAAINEIAGNVKRAELNMGRRELKTSEVKAKDYVGGKETIDGVAHRLWEESGQKFSERDIKNALMDEINTHNTRLEAATAYLERHSPEYQEEQHYARIAEQEKEKWEDEQKELEDQLRKPLDEQIEGEASEEHINNLIKQYEAEIEGENKQPESKGEREVNQKISGRAGREEATTEEESLVEEPSTTSIKNKVTAQERADKGLDEVEVEAKRSFGDVFEKGKKMVDEGKVDPRLLAEEMVRKPRPLTPEESVALLYDRMRIRNEYQKLSAEISAEPDGIRKDLMLAQLDQIENAALINDEAARKTGYEQGLGLAIRKLMIQKDYTLLNQLSEYKLANNGEDLSPEIKKRLEENVSKLDEAQKKLEEYEQKIKDLQAKKAVDTEAKKAKKTNKTAEDFKKEREDIFKNIKDKWDSASKSNIVTAVPVPYSAQLAAISPEVLKLVKSYAEQGITKLEDIVDDLHTNISKSIPQITKKDVKDILAGEYTKKKQVPPIDRKKMELQANVNRIKNQIDLEKAIIKRTQRTSVKKVTDYLQKWRRFALLSGAKVLGKIGLSGTLRAAVTTPIESLIGKGLAKIPGISKIAAGAPREGSTNIKAEARAFSQFVDKATYRDIKETLKTGRGELEYLHDKKLYPSEGWLDFFGQLHAAIKVLPKRAEYFRSLEIRTQHALENGADITDPIVQQDLAAKAYMDAQRAIYMQDNYVTDLYKHVVRFLENSKGLGKPGAEILKFIFPIIKVPTNYVAEESSYILGGVKALYALRKGVSELSPEEKDYIMRALKKQSIGAAFLALGYANPNVVGGYYSGPRKKSDLEAGDLKVAGVKLPHWMLHTPLLEALQFGATIRRARDQAGRSYKQKDLSMFTGVLPATGGVISQVPFAGGSEQITRATKSKDAFDKYVGGQAQGFIEPQLIKELAEFSDYKNGQLTKRDAKTFMDKLKTGIPGLRQQVKPK